MLKALDIIIIIRFLVIGRLQNRFFFGNSVVVSFVFPCLPTSERCDTCTHGVLEPDHVSHTQSMVVKRGLANRANVHTSVWKKSFKTLHGIAPQKIKMPTRGSEVTRAETRGQFHRAAKQRKLLTRNICLADFLGYQPNLHVKLMYFGW